MLKELLNTFAYRLWSQYLPRHSRIPKKNAALKHPQAQHLPAVRKTWDACERFVMLGSMALGILQLIALKFPGQIWALSTLLLRTRSRALPSEPTVKAVLAQALLHDFHNVKPSAIMHAIHHLTHPAHEDDGQKATRTMYKPRAAWT